jgi:hypothetical protein
MYLEPRGGHPHPYLHGDRFAEGIGGDKTNDSPVNGQPIHTLANSGPSSDFLSTRGQAEP